MKTKTKLGQFSIWYYKILVIFSLKILYSFHIFTKTETHNLNIIKNKSLYQVLRKKRINLEKYLNDKKELSDYFVSIILYDNDLCTALQSNTNNTDL